MKVFLIACLFLISLVTLQGCAVQKPAGQPEVEAPAETTEHGDERNIGGDLYRHGRNIHHHPERTLPVEEKAGQ